MMMVAVAGYNEVAQQDFICVYFLLISSYALLCSAPRFGAPSWSASFIITLLNNYY